MMTTLVSCEPFPSKAVAISEGKPIETVAQGRSNWSTIKDHPMWIIAVVACAVAVAVFSATHINCEFYRLKERFLLLKRKLLNSQKDSGEWSTWKDQNTNYNTTKST